MTVIDVQSPEVQVRELRLNSITGFSGTAQELVGCSHAQGVRERTRSFTQGMMCSSTAAFCQLSMIMDAAVINHAPVGCAGDFPQFHVTYRIGQQLRELPPLLGHYYNSNITESDTVFGAAEKLGRVIRAVYQRARPKAIFVTTSCASGIIGDDIEGTVNDAAAELGIPVIACICEGFRSKIWTSGFDSAYHSVVRGLVKPPRQRTKKVNIINFWGSHIFEELLGRLGYEANYILPFSTVEQLQYVSEAAATIQICPTLGSYFGAALEQIHGVPEIKSPPAYGLAGTDKWLRELGSVLGVSQAVEQLIAEEHQRIEPQLARYRRQFEGKTAYLTAGAAHGHAIIALLRELGFYVKGAAIFHHDPLYDNADPASDALAQNVRLYGDVKNYSVCNKQAFEIVNLLTKHRPDILVARHGGMAHWGAKLGIPSFLVDDEQFGFGYQGILNYGERIADTLDNREYLANFAAKTVNPYTQWWLEQDPFCFLGGDTHVQAY
jgi:nitrogenase molybdenum-iron protein alpha chain